MAKFQKNAKKGPTKATYLDYIKKGRYEGPSIDGDEIVVEVRSGASAVLTHEGEEYSAYVGRNDYGVYYSFKFAGHMWFANETTNRNSGEKQLRLNKGMPLREEREEDDNEEAPQAKNKAPMKSARPSHDDEEEGGEGPAGVAATKTRPTAIKQKTVEEIEDESSDDAEEGEAPAPKKKPKGKTYNRG